MERKGMLLLGSARLPTPLETVELGSYRLVRVSGDDPAIRRAYDPAWKMHELFVLYPTAHAEPWEHRAARELASELARDLGTVREVELACEPTAMPPAPGPPPCAVEDRPEMSASAFAAWLADVRIGRDRLDPAVYPSLMPNGAVEARITPRPVIARELDELAAVVRNDRDIALPRAYLDVLRAVGAFRIDWLDAAGRGRAFAELLTPRAIERRLGDFASSDAVVPFYVDEHGVELAFDPTCDPPAIVVFDDDVVMAYTGMSFGQWLATWTTALGVDLTAAIADGSSFRPAPAVRRQWRMIAAWVRPMYHDWSRPRVQARG